VRPATAVNYDYRGKLLANASWWPSSRLRTPHLPSACRDGRPCY